MYFTAQGERSGDSKGAGGSQASLLARPAGTELAGAALFRGGPPPFLPVTPQGRLHKCLLSKYMQMRERREGRREGQQGRKARREGANRRETVGK